MFEEKDLFYVIMAVIFLPMAILIKKVFQLRGLTWQAYVVALLGFIPIVNIFMVFISRSIVGYKDSLATYVLAILAPPSVLIYTFTALIFEFPIVAKIKKNTNKKETQNRPLNLDGTEKN